MTSFEDICSILGELWMNYRNTPDFDDFVSYNDLGLPLAYSISTNIIEASQMSQAYIEETWLLFIESLRIQDVGFETLEQVFKAGEDAGS
jgi:hypothetical protein